MLTVKPGKEGEAVWHHKNWGIVLGDDLGQSDAFLKHWNHGTNCYFQPGQNRVYTAPTSGVFAGAGEEVYFRTHTLQIRAW